MYPDYRFRPVHNKNKEKKVKVPLPVEDEQRCEDVAQLLLEGMKGEELAAAVKRLDRMRSTTPSGLTRRPSSVPLPLNAPGIALPALHLSSASRPQSPDGAARLALPRRPSSAGPAVARTWAEPFSYPTREQFELPEIDESLFEQAFLNGGFSAAGQTPADDTFVSGSSRASRPRRDWLTRSYLAVASSHAPICLSICPFVLHVSIQLSS